jgi:hypothetical protein
MAPRARSHDGAPNGVTATGVRRPVSGPALWGTAQPRNRQNFYVGRELHDQQIAALWQAVLDNVEPDRETCRRIPDQEHTRRRDDRGDHGRDRDGGKAGRSQGAFSAVDRRRLAFDQAMTS